MVRGGSDASVGELQRQICPRQNGRSGAKRVSLLVAHQRKAAGKDAAIGQRRQQLPGMPDAGIMTLHGGGQRAAGAFGKALRALALARDGVALRLRVGEF